MILLSRKKFVAVMPRCPEPDRWFPIINDLLVNAEATTVPRAAAMLAQVAHESGDLRWMKEILGVHNRFGKLYEGRVDLGNVEPGDGVKYIGRGPLQVTGKANYAALGRFVDMDLVSHPEMLEEPHMGANSVWWYWSKHGLNELADRFEFEAMTKIINGGLNGWDHRVKKYVRALEALGSQDG